MKRFFFVTLGSSTELAFSADEDKFLFVSSTSELQALAASSFLSEGEFLFPDDYKGWYGPSAIAFFDKIFI